MRRTRIVLAALLLAFLLGLADATPAGPAAAASVANLAPVVVSGTLPGPALWKVTRGGHEMWILGTLSPLPKHMQWQSDKALDKLGHSSQLLLPPQIEVQTKLGFFGKLSLLPHLIGIRKNPDQARLEQLVPAASYARWQTLKRKYIGSDRGIEKWRPLFAGFELYDAAIKQAGLTRESLIESVVRKAARRHRIATVSTSYVVTVDDPKALVRNFRSERLDDLRCFEKTLDRVESDVARMAARANAWATGDLARLRALRYAGDGMVCADALTGAGFARQLHLSDLHARIQQAWMAKVEQAMATHRTTFALLPVADLLDPQGYVATLRAAGYAVQAPDDEPDGADAAAARSDGGEAAAMGDAMPARQ